MKPLEFKKITEYFLKGTKNYLFWKQDKTISSIFILISDLKKILRNKTIEWNYTVYVYSSWVIVYVLVFSHTSPKAENKTKI